MSGRSEGGWLRATPTSMKLHWVEVDYKGEKRKRKRKSSHSIGERGGDWRVEEKERERKKKKSKSF